MANVEVFIVHDEFGQIIAVNRLAEGTQAVVLSGHGQSVSAVNVDEDSISRLIDTCRVDPLKATLEDL